MNFFGARLENNYRLLLRRDHAHEHRTIEFEASGAQSALIATARHSIGRTAQLFENGRPLLNIYAAADGFWVIMQPGKRSRNDLGIS